jgi:hypothetical protein
MVVMVTVMAAALHLFQTLSGNTCECQIQIFPYVAEAASIVEYESFLAGGPDVR